jgi:cystathionine beta-lyase/cystathionine gamma-synthase
MYQFKPEHGIGTLVTHFTEGSNPLNTHIAPIYQTSTFIFPDLATGAALYRGDFQGYTYTRTTNPNVDQFSRKVALLEAMDLLRMQPGAQVEQVVQGHATAKEQMHAYGGMLPFELEGGLQAGEALLNRTCVATLTVSLGTVDSLIQHPASLTHSTVSPQERLKMGITDGLVRFSVGVENVADLISDLEQSLRENS